MAKHILITGGTGLIGSRLTEMLIEKGYEVAHLSRSKTGAKDIKTYRWDIKKQIIEDGAVENARAIVHLAGASVAGKRWTDDYKEIILKSRTDSSYLLYQRLQTTNHNLEAFIASSAIGYYGDAGDKICTEDSPSGEDFLAYVTREWEAKVQLVDKMGVRRVQLRTGVVLSEKEGALPKIMQPIKLGVGAPLGSGKQFMSWIHLDDLCNMYIRAIEDTDMKGIYNAVSPNPVTNRDFTRIAARVAKKPFFMPSVPVFALKLALGEMAATVLAGQIVSSKKIEMTGFKFQFPRLGDALIDLLR
ncbi:MAG: TIGR01777 family oxidoreductase [Cyclobacteriaceae bacterium]